ncbi:MAG TPA: AtpZ/AtpI family protein [Pyrinomonadaceae bacterium]|nr:AtpZ/AtpI family protein [Pyrinomonadaceae bacterium]
MKDEEDKSLNEDEQFEKDKKDGFYQNDPHPESEAEANRKSGLAYGAVTTLIGAILLFLAIGWGVDKYFQTSPWGIVIGIILGSVLGFYQFIRVTSQID